MNICCRKHTLNYVGQIVEFQVITYKKKKVWSFATCIGCSPLFRYKVLQYLGTDISPVLVLRVFGFNLKFKVFSKLNISHRTIHIELISDCIHLTSEPKANFNKYRSEFMN